MKTPLLSIYINVDHKKHNLLIIIICMSLYVINRLTKFHEVDEFVLKYIWDYNFTDFLCQIVYFSLCNLFLESINRKGIYSFKTILVLCAVCCLYWEIGVQYTRTSTVFDVADWASYFLGAMAYYGLFRLITVVERGKNKNNSFNNSGI